MASMDRATPNLPSRNFEATANFYGRLGFGEVWRDASWMILQRGPVVLEFFPHPDLDPAGSWFSFCLRLDDADAFYDACLAAGVSAGADGYSRLHPLEAQAWGARAGALIDLDGTLCRLIQN